ncbi:FecR family protein [Gilvibacter sediminis]|uniref:FecR family protein n=1 Tax=Gilvibacter sediminis TaxID=379071 RepID=UPI00234FD2B5|nr:FecR domain-containing protein [Gilvibacter sediminis]MDC7997666.1 FecR domain-containing protein [Gilvibacter sediminis]
MNKQELLHKWMNDELTGAEQSALREDPEMRAMMEIAAQTRSMEAPEFPKDAVWKNIQQLNKPTKVRTLQPLKYMVRIAAVFAIVAFSYVFWQGLDTDINTAVAEKTEITLPDQSQVALNADSFLTYNEQDWKDARTLHLDGEAYFKVAKGSAFVVETDLGDVTVLGTQFNVFARENLLKVSCFEGVVSVSLDQEVITLKAGEALELETGSAVKNLTTSLSTPRWLQDESSFNNAPLAEVLNELEHYYNIQLEVSDIDLQKRFTGSFTHQDLDIALQSICNPLQMTYSVLDQNKVVLNEAK